MAGGAGVRRTTTETLFGVQEVSSAYLDKPLYNDISQVDLMIVVRLGVHEKILKPSLLILLG